MRRWRVHYADGSTYDSSQGRPEDAPPRGVVVIAQSRATDDVHGLEVELQQRWDWYFWHLPRGEWWGCDLSGLLDRLLWERDVGPVIQGVSVPTPEFRAALERARQLGVPR